MSYILNDKGLRMDIKAVPVREYLQFKPEEMVYGLKFEQNVLFDDGVAVVTAHEVIVSSYFWKLVDDLNHIYKQSLPINRELCINNFYSNGFFVDGSLKNIIRYIFKIVNENYTFVYNKRDINNDFILPRIAQIYNDIYNDVVQNVTEYSNSLFITDILDIQFNENILGAIKKFNKTKTDVESAYKVVHETIRLPQYENNIISKGVISGTYNKGQINQIFGPVGYVSELNSMVFKEPISSSFTLGLIRSFDIAANSRVAAKSLYFASKAIENSEYLGRLTQLIGMQVENLVDGDCGNTDYLEWKVEEHSSIGKSELDLLSGKFYLDPETNTEKMINRTDTHLLGKIIKIRTALTCKHPHSKSICVRCFGGLAANVPYTTNIGHVCSASASRELSQSLLSTKHQADSSNSIIINLHPSLQGYVNLVNNNYLVFNKDYISKSRQKRIMVFPQSCVKELFNITADIKISNITPNKLTAISTATIIEIDKKGVARTAEVDFSINKTKSKSRNKILGYFTTAFVQYILAKPERLQLDFKEDVEIDFTEWDNSTPFLEYPKLEYNLIDLTNEIKTLIRKESGYIETPHIFLQNFFMLLNTKLNVNLALIEIMTLALCVSSNEDGSTNYHLTRDPDKVRLAKLNDILYNVSLGGSYGFERHDDYLMTTKTFNGHNNVDHSLDGILMPNEVYKAVEDGLRN